MKELNDAISEEKEKENKRVEEYEKEENEEEKQRIEKQNSVSRAEANKRIQTMQNDIDPKVKAFEMRLRSKEYITNNVDGATTVIPKQS